MKKITTLFLVLILVMGMAATASAAAHLTFNPQKVYFIENGDLIVEGTVTNHGSHDGYLNKIILTVYKGLGENAREITRSGIVLDKGFIAAKSTETGRFVIKNVVYTELKEWEVKAKLEFSW